MAETKAVIKSADMSEEMQQEAIECSTQALEKYNIEKDIAAHIKREFDKKYGMYCCCCHHHLIGKRNKLTNMVIFQVPPGIVLWVATLAALSRMVSKNGSHTPGSPPHRDIG